MNKNELFIQLYEEIVKIKLWSNSMPKTMLY